MVLISAEMLGSPISEAAYFTWSGDTQLLTASTTQVAEASSTGYWIVLTLAAILAICAVVLIQYGIRLTRHLHDVALEADRLLRLLSGSPRFPETLGFESYEGSALQKVEDLHEGIKGLGATLSTHFQRIGAEIGGLTSEVRGFEIVRRRLQEENDRFREGFLAAHSETILSRVAQVRDKCSYVETEKLVEFVRVEMDEILREACVSRIDESELLENRVGEENAGFCEVVGREFTTNQEEVGVISAVLSPAYVVEGSPTRRVLRRAQVRVYQLEAASTQDVKADDRGMDPEDEQ